MEAAFCVETLEDALARHGKPDIFNTDQGSQPRFKPSSQWSFLPSSLLHQKPQLAFASPTSSLAWS